MVCRIKTMGVRQVFYSIGNADTFCFLRFDNSAVGIFQFPVYHSQPYDTIVGIPYPKAVRC